MATTDIKVAGDASVVNGATTVGPFDVTSYSAITVQTFGAAHAGINLTFEVSQDGTNWVSTTLASVNSNSALAGATGVLTTNASNGWLVPVVGWSWFRIRSTAYTSGTLTVQVTGSTNGVAATSVVQLVTTPPVLPGASATSSGASTNHHLVAAATTNQTSVKATAGAIASIVMANTSAAIKFVKLFNKATAPVTGTDTPTVTFAIPPGTTLTWDPAIYYRMTVGIAYAITNLSPDLDNTAVTAGDVIVSMQYV